MANLDEQLDKVLSNIIGNGQFQSDREFVIIISEVFYDEYYENPMHQRLAIAKARIKQAFVDNGWSPVGITGNVSEMPVDRHYLVGSKGQSDVPLMTGQEWLSNALKDIWAFQTGRDYFRNTEQFKKSTVTIAEVEKLLQKAAGLE